MNKKGYEFYCADNSFNENEFLYESKILIIKFDWSGNINSYLVFKSI